MARNLTEVLEALDAELTPGEKAKIRDMSREELMALHLSFGLFIRNRFIHPTDSVFGQRAQNLLGDPDSISSFLIAVYWNHLNGRALSQSQLASLLPKYIWFVDGEQAPRIVEDLYRVDAREV